MKTEKNNKSIRKHIEEYWTDQTIERETQISDPLGLAIFENKKLGTDLMLTHYTEVSTEQTDGSNANRVHRSEHGANIYNDSQRKIPIKVMKKWQLILSDAACNARLQCGIAIHTITFNDGQ